MKNIIKVPKFILNYHFCVIGQESYHVVGRICVQSSDRQVFLEDVSGSMLQLNLSSLNDYLLLPGQVSGLVSYDWL